MVERFHQQLKVSLKAQPNPDAWMTTQPIILLGIRTALKQDLNATAAEMVYGITLRLPGEFFTPFQPPLCNTLKSHFLHIEPISPRPTTTEQIFLQNYPQQHTSSSAIMQFANPYSLHTMVHILSLTELTNISPSNKQSHRYCRNRPPKTCMSQHYRHITGHRHIQMPNALVHKSIPPPQPHSSNLVTLTPATPTTPTTRSGRHVNFPKYLTQNV